MFKIKIEKLIKEYGVKRNAIIELINSDRVSFAKKIKDNSFTDSEKNIIMKKYGTLFS